MFIRMEKLFLHIANIFSKNRILHSLRLALEKCLPVLTIGCLFLFLGQMPFSIVQDFFVHIFGLQWQMICLNIAGVCFYLAGFIVSVFIAIYHSKYLKINTLSSVLIVIVSFCCLFYNVISNIIYTLMNEGVLLSGSSRQALQYVGSDGILIGIFSSFSMLYLFLLFHHFPFILKGLEKIKQFVTNKWNKIIPQGVIHAINYILIFSILSFVLALVCAVFGLFTVSDIEVVVTRTVDTTTQYNFNAIGTNLVLVCLSSISTFFSVCLIELSEIISLAGNALNAENLQAFQTGLVLPNIFNGSFFNFFIVFGGFGSTLSLVLVMFVIAKSDRIKKVARYSLIPSLFGMNVTLLYGLPIFLNPIIIIPFILVPVINLCLSYCAVVVGILPVALGNDILWTMPIGLSGYLTTLSVSAVLWQLFLVFIGSCIYYPFVRVLDKNYLKADIYHLLEKEKIELSVGRE